MSLSRPSTGRSNPPGNDTTVPGSSKIIAVSLQSRTNNGTSEKSARPVRSNVLPSNGSSNDSQAASKQTATPTPAMPAQPSTTGNETRVPLRPRTIPTTPQVAMDLSSGAKKPPIGKSDLSGTNLTVAPPIRPTASVDLSTSNTATSTAHQRQSGPPAASISLTSTKPPLQPNLRSSTPIATVRLSNLTSAPVPTVHSTLSSPSLSPRSIVHDTASSTSPLNSVLDQAEQKRSNLLAKVSARVEADLGETLKPLQAEEALEALKRGEASVLADGGKNVVAFSMTTGASRSAAHRANRRKRQQALEDDDDPSLPIALRRTRAIGWLLERITLQENPLYCPSWFTAVDSEAMIHLADVRQQYLTLVHTFSLREQALAYLDDLKDAYLEQKGKVKHRSRLNMLRVLQGKKPLPWLNQGRKTAAVQNVLGDTSSQHSVASDSPASHPTLPASRMPVHMEQQMALVHAARADQAAAASNSPGGSRKQGHTSPGAISNPHAKTPPRIDLSSTASFLHANASLASPMLSPVAHPPTSSHPSIDGGDTTILGMSPILPARDHQTTLQHQHPSSNAVQSPASAAAASSASSTLHRASEGLRFFASLQNAPLSANGAQQHLAPSPYAQRVRPIDGGDAVKQEHENRTASNSASNAAAASPRTNEVDLSFGSVSSELSNSGSMLLRSTDVSVSGLSSTAGTGVGGSTTGPSSLALLSRLPEFQIHRVLRSFHTLLVSFPLLIKHAPTPPHRPDSWVPKPKLTAMHLMNGRLYWNWKGGNGEGKALNKSVRLVDIVAIKSGLSKNVSRRSLPLIQPGAQHALEEFCFHILAKDDSGRGGDGGSRKNDSDEDTPTHTTHPAGITFYRELNLQVDSIQHKREWLEGLQLMVLLAMAEKQEKDQEEAASAAASTSKPDGELQAIELNLESEEEDAPFVGHSSEDENDSDDLTDDHPSEPKRRSNTGAPAIPIESSDEDFSTDYSDEDYL